MALCNFVKNGETPALQSFNLTKLSNFDILPVHSVERCMKLSEGVNDMAEWLDSFFYKFDHCLLEAMSKLAQMCGEWLTSLMKIITFCGEKGILMFLLALVFVLFRKTRRNGVGIFGAVSCGALITNIILKDTVARLRPFLSGVEDYAKWWSAIGSPAESGYSFPSGHVTAAAAGITAFFIFSKNKKISWISYLYVAFVALSRIYLMAHYPSDVLAALLIGIASAFIAFGITRLIFALLEKYRNVKFFAFVLDFDIRELFDAPKEG